MSVRYAFKYTHEQVPTTCREDAVGSSFFRARAPQSCKALEQPLEQSQTQKGKVQGDMLLNVALNLSRFTFPLKFCVQGPLRAMRERRSERVAGDAAHSARAGAAPTHPAGRPWAHAQQITERGPAKLVAPGLPSGRRGGAARVLPRLP